MAMSKQQEADFRRLQQSVSDLREGLMEALRRLADVETAVLANPPKRGRPPKSE
jgi:hypothetical protein